MFFRDIIGQEEIKQRFIRQVREERIPHAQLLCGPEGVGKYPLAIAFARYLSCTNRLADDACGKCPSCQKFNKLVHPDLHLVFPVIRKKNQTSDTAAVSDDYIALWRNFVLSNPYFQINDWIKEMDADNQQAIICTRESDVLFQKITFKSSEGGYKIVVIWLPEKMHVVCANKLLKMLEEPPEKTVFLLVSEAPDMLLQTIQSRVQRINVPVLEQQLIEETLIQRYSLAANDAQMIAHQSMGSWRKAVETIHLSEENGQYLECFISLMRLAYQRKIREMKQWSEQVAALGRERQKNLLIFCQRMIRENFIYNFKCEEIVYMTADERDFSRNFSPFVNENNIVGIMDELSEAQKHIEQNVNAKMVFFDFALKMIVLIKNR